MGIQTIVLIIILVIIGTAALILRQRYYESMIRRERALKSGPPSDTESEGRSESPSEVRRHADGLFPDAPPTGGEGFGGAAPDEAKKDEEPIPSPSVSIALGALSGLTGAPPVFVPPSHPKPQPAAPPPPAPAQASPTPPSMNPPSPIRQTGEQAPASNIPPGSAPIPQSQAPIAAEDVRFTAYYPKEAAVETWYTLLVYAHIDSAFSKVQTDAAKFKDEMGGMPREIKAPAPARLQRGTEISIVPECDGVTFNPPRVSLKWIEDVHRADFRLQATKDMAGEAANIRVTVYVGPLIVATIKGGILFDDSAPQPTAPGVDTGTSSATMYKAEQIFPSYSHTDEKIVIACRNAYRAIGFEYLRDRDMLRPGEKWDETLLQYIDRADIFQLFWSPSAATSPYVREEWEHALKISSQKDPGFIRPVFWQEPLVPPPAELEPLHFTFVPLATD